MTDADWVDCNSPRLMLDFLQGKVSGRKLRLFAVACSRRISHLFIDADCRTGLDVAERYADGLASEEERQGACETLLSRGAGSETPIEAWEVWLSASGAVGFSASPDPFAAASHAARYARDAALNAAVPNPSYPVEDSDDEVLTDKAAAFSRNEAALQCELLRDIFGNPFRPVVFDSSWLTSNPVALANQMYESRDFNAMPILADALQDAGCEDEQILGHCRGPGPHVRGCWVVDLVLGKK